MISTALAIIDADGLDALTMRRLGAELDADPMALYRHVANKQALLDLIVEEVLTQTVSRIDHRHDGPIDAERILAGARTFRQTVLAHPNAAAMVLGASPHVYLKSQSVVGLMRALERAGVALERTGFGLHALLAVMRGLILAELAPRGDEPPHADSAPAPDEFDREAYLDEVFDFTVLAVLNAILQPRP